MISTSDFRKGRKVEFKGDPCEIVDFQHVKMGKRQRNRQDKDEESQDRSVLEETIRSGEKFPARTRREDDAVPLCPG